MSTELTAFYIAAYMGHAEVVKLLLERGANREVRDITDGATALGDARKNGHIEVVELLTVPKPMGMRMRKA